MASFIQNYKHRENICFRMLDAYERHFDEISEIRKSYLCEQLIFQYRIQYNLTISIMHSRKAFLSFDRDCQNIRVYAERNFAVEK